MPRAFYLVSVAGRIATPRFSTMLLLGFAALALLLTAVGLYGVIAYSVYQRTHEMGIRIALGAHVANQRSAEIGIRLAMGAQPASIVTLLLGHGLRLLGIGAVIGLTGAFVGTRYIEAQLFGVSATDPVTFVGVCVVLGIAGLAASVIPALRAMRVDPITVLRRT